METPKTATQFETQRAPNLLNCSGVAFKKALEKLRAENYPKAVPSAGKCFTQYQKTRNVKQGNGRFRPKQISSHVKFWQISSHLLQLKQISSHVEFWQISSHIH